VGYEGFTRFSGFIFMRRFVLWYNGERQRRMFRAAVSRPSRMFRVSLAVATVCGDPLAHEDRQRSFPAVLERGVTVMVAFVRRGAVHDTPLVLVTGTTDTPETAGQQLHEYPPCAGAACENPTTFRRGSVNWFFVAAARPRPAVRPARSPGLREVIARAPKGCRIAAASAARPSITRRLRHLLAPSSVAAIAASAPQARAVAAEAASRPAGRGARAPAASGQDGVPAAVGVPTGCD